jgi:glc operon protein GlcG
MYGKQFIFRDRGNVLAFAGQAAGRAVAEIGSRGSAVHCAQPDRTQTSIGNAHNQRDPERGGFMCRMSVAAMVLIVSTVSVDVGAQSISVHRVEISSDAARKMVEACVAYAERNKLLVGAAVVGIDGVLIDFHLMPGATATNSETAILKAKTAAHWRRPTRELEEWVKTGSNGAPAWIGDFPRAGGVPIVIDGMVAGAIGVGGGGDGGDDCAQYAIDTVIRKRP